MPSQLPGLNAYRNYCSNQLAAKALLDQKKQDRRVQDFLQRCLESPFSRKLDLWSFLDIPRSRLVKYPLLLREILRHTPPDHPDVTSLEKAVCSTIFLSFWMIFFGPFTNVYYYFIQIAIIQEILSDINVRKGESECQYYIDKLEYLDEKQRDPLIDNCKTLLCHGELRTKSGSVGGFPIIFWFLWKLFFLLLTSATSFPVFRGYTYFSSLSCWFWPDQ